MVTPFGPGAAFRHGEAESTLFNTAVNTIFPGESIKPTSTTLGQAEAIADKVTSNPADIMPRLKWEAGRSG